MKQQNNRRAHRTMAVVLATGIIALFVGVLPASAFGPNNIEAKMVLVTIVIGITILNVLNLGTSMIARLLLALRRGLPIAGLPAL